MQYHLTEPTTFLPLPLTTWLVIGERGGAERAERASWAGRGCWAGGRREGKEEEGRERGVLGRAGKSREREKDFAFSFEIDSNKFNLNSNFRNSNSS